MIVGPPNVLVATYRKKRDMQASGLAPLEVQIVLVLDFANYIEPETSVIAIVKSLPKNKTNGRRNTTGCLPLKSTPSSLVSLQAS